MYRKEINMKIVKIRNEKILNKFNEVKTLKEGFETRFNKELYPRTKNARKFLIDKEFITLDYVKPRIKTFSKTLFKFFGI